MIVFVEGTDAVDNDFYWWGSNLEGVRHAPVRLDVPNQLVYSAHDYGPNEYHQKWFDGATPASLEAVFARHWGYISCEGIAPVWVGEFGTSNKTQDIRGSASGSEGQWFQSLVAYLGKNSDISWTSWALNGEDANGLLDSDYQAPSNPFKLVALNILMSKPAAAQPGGTMLIAAQPRSVAAQYQSRLTRSSYAATGGAAIQPYKPHLPASVLRPRPAYDEEGMEEWHRQQTLPEANQAASAGAGRNKTLTQILDLSVRGLFTPFSAE